MRKASALLVALTLMGTAVNPASGVTKASVVSTAFRNLLNSISEAEVKLEQEYESQVDVLDSVLATATNVAETTYNLDLSNAITTYEPQKILANQKAQAAKTAFESNNQVRLTTGFFENNDRLNNVLDCLPPRQTEVLKMLKRYCAKVEGIPVFGEYGYGGEDWQKNDVTTIALRNADDKYVAIGIEKGYIIPFNLAIFDSSRIEYKQALAEIDRLTSLSGKARAAAASKRDSSIALAKNTRETSLTDLNEEFESGKNNLRVKEATANLALLATKRASKDPNFDTAFVIAYKFEYNRQKIGAIADAAWTGEWTYRTIDSIIKVNKLAALGDFIAAKYSKNQAIAFNSAIGNAFTNEPDFRANLKVLIETYKQATKIILKI